MTGLVTFAFLPLAHRQRLIMYAGGIGMTALAVVLFWLVPVGPYGLVRGLATACFLASTLDNLLSTNPESDGAAIRGLIKLSQSAT